MHKLHDHPKQLKIVRPAGIAVTGSFYVRCTSKIDGEPMAATAQETLHVRVSEPIAAAARATAEQRGMPLSEFVRLALRRETGLDDVKRPSAAVDL